MTIRANVLLSVGPAVHHMTIAAIESADVGRTVHVMHHLDADQAPAGG